MTLRATRHLETTVPVVISCSRCLGPVIYGIAEGIPARADAAPLTSLQEIGAVLAGRQTYTLQRAGLVQRDADRRSDPGLAGPVLAEHTCPGVRHTP